MSYLANPRPILITGASGFIGSHLARRLAHTGACVVGTCTARHRASRVQNLPPNFLLESADLRNPASVESLFASHRFGTVFHLAAQGVQAESAADNQAANSAIEIAGANAAGSMALAQIALRYGVDRFVYCGSGLEYESGDLPVDESAPLAAPNLYGASKAAGWLLLDYLCRVEGLPLTTVRPFTVFGPAESEGKLIPYVIARALRRETLQLSAGTQVRDYVYVSDVVDALILAATSENVRGAVFNIGSGAAEARTIRSVVETALDLIGAPRSLCRFGEARRTRPDPAGLVSNSARAIARLGWKPRVTLEAGLSRTIRSIASEPIRAAAA
jgi:UDP-glucose 4-epimerase